MPSTSVLSYMNQRPLLLKDEDLGETISAARRSCPGSLCSAEFYTCVAQSHNHSSLQSCRMTLPTVGEHFANWKVLYETVNPCSFSSWVHYLIPRALLQLSRLGVVCRTSSRIGKMTELPSEATWCRRRLHQAASNWSSAQCCGSPPPPTPTQLSGLVIFHHSSSLNSNSNTI